jgi:hypothetical protein
MRIIKRITEFHFLKRPLAFFMLLLITFTAVSCTEKPDLPGKDSDGSGAVHKTNVVRDANIGITEYGDYVYCTWGKIFRYNRKTGEFSRACADSECDGTCPLDNIVGYILQIVDGKLYFGSMEAYTHNYTYGYQDIITGEVKVLRVCSESEGPELCAPCVSGGYIYYMSKILREDGNAQNPDDYLSYVCRMSVEGGKEEIVFGLQDNYELLKFVSGGKLVTYIDGILYSIDIETKERTVIFDGKKEGYLSFGDYMSCLDGKIYFLCKTNSGMQSEYNNITYSYSYLMCLSLETGEAKRIVDKPIISFCLTDDAVYYTPFELRHMYIPEDYKEHPENVVVFLASPELHSCDLDGGNDKILYTNKNMDFAKLYTVIDGVLYGWLWDYDESLHRFGSTYFGIINLSTGKVTATVKPK